MAKRTSESKGDRDAIPYLQRAVTFDPNYARAYLMLSACYSNVGEDSLAIQHAIKAFELRDRLNQRYRLGVEAHYFDLVTGESTKASEALSRGVELFPKNANGHDNLGANLISRGQYEKSISELQEGLRLYPEGVFAYWVLMNGYLGLAQLNEAKSVFEAARARKFLYGPQLRDARYRLAFMEGDLPSMQEQVTWSVGKQGVEDLLLSEESETAAYFGRFTRARDFSRRAVQSAISSGNAETAADGKAREAWREGEIGDATRARQAAEQALKMNPVQAVKVLSAIVSHRMETSRGPGSWRTNAINNFRWIPSFRSTGCRASVGPLR